MAITKSLPKLKVEVFVKDTPLEEHNDDEEQTSPDSLTTYIEASSGDHFEIRYSFLPGFSIKHDLECQIYIDGKYADSHVLLDGSRIDWNRVRIFKGTREVEKGKFFTRKFRFSQLDTDDSDIRSFDAALKKKLDDVGVISVRYFWVKAGPISTPVDTTAKLNTLGVIPEKALKGSALSHEASYGCREVGEKYTTCSTTRLSQTPFATYNFKYRSRAALKSLMILPRSPSPVPLEDRDVDTLTSEESRELIRRLRERDEAARANIKQEGVKRERGRERSSTINGFGEDDDEISFVSAKRRRLPVTINEDGVETIDLT